MNEIILKNKSFPTTIEDLSKFVLIGREKLISVKAEIRAIDKLEVAQEVRNQKKEECSLLGEALLDAEARIGDLLKQIPKTSGGDRNSENFKKCSTAHFEEIKILCSTTPNPKTKKEVIQDLGFSIDQAKRFETLADNKDLIEQVKQEARENDDIPTRTRVLDLAKAKKEKENQQEYKNTNKYIEDCAKRSKFINHVVHDLNAINDQDLEMWKQMIKNEPLMISSYLEIVKDDIPILIKIEKFLKELM